MVLRKARMLGDRTMEPGIKYGYRRNRHPQPLAPSSNHGSRAGIMERRKVFQSLNGGDDFIVNADRIGIALSPVDDTTRHDVEIFRASDSARAHPARVDP